MVQDRMVAPVEINYITIACCDATSWLGQFSARISLQTAANAKRYVLTAI